MFIKTKQLYQLTEFDNLENGIDVIGIQVSDITLINFYNSPTKHLSKNWLDLISSYRNVILVGDFDAYHPRYDPPVKTWTVMV